MLNYKLMSQRKCIKKFKYKGFLVEVFDNTYYGLRYEYCLTPITLNTKKILERNTRFYQPVEKLYDVTSHMLCRYCVDAALSHISDILRPILR